MDAGWRPELLREEYLVMLFRPHVKVVVRREAVSPYGGMRYHAAGLGDWNGKEVVVAYDIMDWRHVWVKTLTGELICVAAFQEATGYRTQTAQEAAAEKRALSQIKHRERQIDVIRERLGGEVIDVLPAISAPPIDLLDTISDAELSAMEARRPQAESLPDLLQLADAEPAEAPARSSEMTLMDMAMWLYPGEPDGPDDDTTKDSAAG